MASEMGELRYDAPELPQDCREIARKLDLYGRVTFRYAAFGTEHCMIGIDARALLIASNTQREDDEYEPPLHRGLWVGGRYGIPPGLGDPLENGHTLWIRGGDNQGKAVWMNRCGYHDPTYLAEKFMDGNIIDGTGLAVLFLLVEVYRGMVYDIVPTIETWVDRLPEGPERELPTFCTQPDEDNEGEKRG